MQDPEINLIGAMRVGGMSFRFYVRCIVMQQIENVMAFVFMRTDDLGINGDMVRNLRVSTYTLL